MGHKDFTYSVLDKATTDHAQVVDLTEHRRKLTHQIQVKVSAEPTAGTLGVQIRTPGTDEYWQIGSIDLTDPTNRIVQYVGNADSVRFVPASLDSDKTYSVFGYLV